MTFYEQMVPLLSNLLEIGETLKAPICGTLLQKKAKLHIWIFRIERKCDIGIPSSRRFEKLKGTNRIPFSNIQKTKVRKSLFPLQYILQIYLTDGDNDKVPNI